MTSSSSSCSFTVRDPSRQGDWRSGLPDPGDPKSVEPHVGADNGNVLEQRLGHQLAVEWGAAIERKIDRYRQLLVRTMRNSLPLSRS